MTFRSTIEDALYDDDVRKYGGIVVFDASVDRWVFYPNNRIPVEFRIGPPMTVINIDGDTATMTTPDNIENTIDTFEYMR